MDIINQEHQPSSPLQQFCSLCLRARLPDVQFYEQIVSESDELQESLQSLLGYDFQLENFTMCKPCWKITQLFQDFRLRCVKANRLVERLGLGLGCEDEWLSERNLTTIEGIRVMIKDQLQEIERLTEYSCEDGFLVKPELAEIKPEPIDEDLIDSNEGAGCFPDGEIGWQFKQNELKDAVEEAIETNLDIREIKIESNEACAIDESHPKGEEDELHKPITNRMQSSRSYQCPECPITFNNHRRLAAHVIKHAGNRPFKCRNSCEKSFTTTMNRRKHERRCGKEVFQCNLCEVQLDRRRALYDHYNLVHPEEPRHPCSHCEKRFKKKEQLQRHEKRIHSGERRKEWTCEQCGRTFAENSFLRRHMTIHI